MLTNPFYIGQFEWGGHSYRGTHTSLITPQLSSDVQAVLRGTTSRNTQSTILLSGAAYVCS